jgi:hypothetical protein
MVAGRLCTAEYRPRVLATAARRGVVPEDWLVAFPRGWPLPTAVIGALVAAAGAAALISYRILTSPAYMSPDGWVYTGLGRELLHGGRLHHAFPPSVLKPLAITLGIVTGPFAPEHAYQLAIGLSIAVLIGALFFAGYERGGPAAAFGAVAALTATPAFSDELLGASIDLFAAALVVLAIAVPRGRLLLLVLAGLLRPEAWLITGFVASQRPGSFRKRAAFAIGAAALAPALWAGFDLLIAAHVSSTGSDVASGSALRGDLFSALHEVARSLGVEGGVVVVSIGVVGLVVRSLRTRLRDPDDVVAAAVVIGWPATDVVLYLGGVPPAARYVVPAVAALALEVGLLVGTRRLRFPFTLAVILTLAWCTGVVLLAEPTAGQRSVADDYTRVKRSASAIQQALNCGPLSITGDDRVGRGVWTRRLEYFVPEIAVVADRPLANFRLRATKPLFAELRIYGTAPPRPGWRPQRLPLGQLSSSPDCP